MCTRCFNTSVNINVHSVFACLELNIVKWLHMHGLLYNNSKFKDFLILYEEN